MSMSPRIGLCVLLMAATASANERSEGLNAWLDFGGLLVMTDALHQSQAICENLFPSQAAVIRGYYEASSVPTYVQAIGPTLRPPPTGNRDKLLAALGKSESEAASWCSTGFPEALGKFDALYADRVQELVPGIENLRDAAPATPPAVELQPTAELDGLFAKIVERSNRAYQTGNWSVLADLYEPGTFDCWRGVPGADKFDFLAFPPLSSKATYVVSQFTEYDPGEPYSFSRVTPTHLMEFANDTSRPGGRCGMEIRGLWPGGFFYLVQRGDQYHLTHFCPSKAAVSAGEIERSRTLSVAQTAANVARLSAEDWEAIASDIRQDRYSDLPQNRLVKNFGLSSDEADDVIGYVCDPANSP